MIKRAGENVSASEVEETLKQHPAVFDAAVVAVPDPIRDHAIKAYVLLKEGVTEHRITDHGNAWALYFKDPEGNPVELYVDSHFYTPQPCGEPLDLDQPNDEILARTEAMCRSRPRFMSREAWMQGIQARLDAR